MENCAETAAAYIETLNSGRALDLGVDDDLPERELGETGRIDGFSQLVDEYIDQLCPSMEFQIEFCHGAKTAEQIFLRTFESIKNVKQMNSQFN